MTSGQPKLTLVKINNVDVGTTLFDWDQAPSLGNKFKSVVISLSRGAYALVPELETSPTGLSVTIQRGESVSTEEWVFRGTILKRDTIGNDVFLKCNDKMFKAVQKNITKTFNSNIDTEAGVVSEIFKTLCTTSGLTFSSSSIQDSGTVIILKTFICNNADVFERMQRLAELLDWQFYYNSTDDLVYFEPKGTRAGTETLTIGTNVINRPKWKRDGEKVVKIVKLFGGPVQTGTTNEFTASASQTVFELSEIATSVRVTVDGDEKLGGLEGQSIDVDYFLDSVDKTVTFQTPLTGGEAVVIEITFLSPLTLEGSNPVSTGLEIRLDKPDLVKVSDAENYLNTFLARFGVDFLSTTLQVTKVIDLEVGQTVIVVDDNESISQTFIITKLRKKFPYAFDEVEVSTEPLQIEDWQISIEDRIKRIEEKLSQEETLVIFIRAGQRTIKIGREYAKFETQAINDSFVLGHIDNSILGASGTPLGNRDSNPVLQQLIQGGNIYIEDFLDEDFNDSSTANWSNTGSVNFTSGQVATSSSVEFNNGEITQAKLTSIEVSGSFDYEMTADGTNWESVTSGVLHTFTDTGTDLRWRTTENSASTGSISEIKIEDFRI